MSRVNSKVPLGSLGEMRKLDPCYVIVRDRKGLFTKIGGNRAGLEKVKERRLSLISHGKESY